jgi:cell division protease FtsH
MAPSATRPGRSSSTGSSRRRGERRRSGEPPDRALDRLLERLGRLPLPALTPRLVLAATLVALFATLAAALSYLAPASPGRELSLSELSEHIDGGRVVEATFLDEDARITGRLSGGGDGGQDPDGFWVAYPKSDSVTALLLQELTAAGAEVGVDAQAAKATVGVLSTVVLPLMILANLFALLFAAGRGNGALGDIRGFGAIGRRGGGRAEPPAVKFSDVAGADEAVAELAEVVAYLDDPDRYAALGASPPKGVLLFGPPGCGKTLIARATAGEAGVPFFSVAGAEFVESLVGIGAARIRDLFARVRAVAPAIVFIDELDAAGRRRGVESGGGSDEREQTLNQLLVEMDGFDADVGIVVMGATNRPDILDPALLRPGRFDRHVVIDHPDVVGREKILRLHARGKPMSSTVDLAHIARRTPGFTGADLANVVNEAALLAIREGKPQIEPPELTEAIQRVVSGPQRRGRVLSDDERRRIAYHEVGHAIVAAAGGHGDEVHRVSIVARGRGLAAVTLGTDRDAVLLTSDQLHAQLTAAMAGRAAEELVFSDASTGSERDLEAATDLARDIAARYGMSPRLGRVRLLAGDTDLYLGGSSGLERLSGLVHQELDVEIRHLLDEAFDAATAILGSNRTLLDDLVGRVLQEETVEGPALDAALRQVAPTAPAEDAPAAMVSRH